jgi:mono/diheme cytochrome c family protein
MSKHILITAFAAMLALGMTCAGQTPGKVVIPVNKTASNDGKQMYSNYCAPCHGVDGRGHGPVAPALKVQPTDLTILSKDNLGKFPDSHIATVLQFGAEMPSHGSAHGSAEMPVWGPILGNMSRSNSAAEKQQRISNLTQYLKTIQVE